MLSNRRAARMPHTTEDIVEESEMTAPRAVGPAGRLQGRVDFGLLLLIALIGLPLLVYCVLSSPTP